MAVMDGRRPTDRPRILVLGVGNVLLGDEGFGIHAVRRLMSEGIGSDVVVEDGGTGGVDLLEMITAFDSVIVIDLLRVAPAGTEGRGGAAPDEPGDSRALDVERGSGAMGGLATGGDVRRDLVPGAVVVFRLNRVELLNPDPDLSLHGCSLGGLIRLARALDVPLPEITVIGTVAESIRWSTELSAQAERAVGEAVAATRRIVDSIHGALPQPTPS